MRGEVSTCVSVFLRKKSITQGRSSLYLDFYPAIRNPKTMKMTRREFLGIYIYDHPQKTLALGWESAFYIRILREPTVTDRMEGVSLNEVKNYRE